MSAADADVIDTMVGIRPGSALDAIRARRPEARIHAQKSYRALFAPEIPGDVGAVERFAIAAFVAGLHGVTDMTAFYTAGLEASGAAAGLRRAVIAAVAEAKGTGPYGSYPSGPLSRENTIGPVYRAGATTRDGLGPRLAAAFEHVHMLVFHPRDAEAPALQALLDAGWSTTGIVTLSQLVAFLSFQIRLVTGLRVLASHS
jgi:CMD domain protein